nr:DUF3037 domain-containing protein [Cyclobacterium marinum]
MMQENHLYEYAILRVVPRVEREEFVNVGVILCDHKSNFLDVKLHFCRKKIVTLDADADLEMIHENLKSFEKICKGENDGGPIANMDLASRFRWLTAVRSSIIQTSRPHPGLSKDLPKTLQQLFEEYVM